MQRSDVGDDLGMFGEPNWVGAPVPATKICYDPVT